MTSSGSFARFGRDPTEEPHKRIDVGMIAVRELKNATGVEADLADKLSELNNYFEDWPTDGQATNASDDDFCDHLKKSPALSAVVAHKAGGGAAEPLGDHHQSGKPEQRPLGEVGEHTGRKSGHFYGNRVGGGCPLWPRTVGIRSRCVRPEPIAVRTASHSV